MVVPTRTAGRWLYIERIIDIVLGVPVFFLLRLSFIWNMHILGPAYFCTLLSKRLRRTGGLAFAILGIVTLPSAELKWKYGLIFLNILWLDFLWKRLVKEEQPALQGLCYAASLPIAVLSLWMLRRINGYQFIMTLLEAAIFYGFIRMYGQCLRILENQRYHAFAGFSENLLETACFTGTLLASIASYTIWQISPYQVLHMLLVATVCYRCGMGKGMTFTVITVLLLRLSGCCTEGYGMLCMILALLGGCFRDMGRLAQSVAGISGGMLYLMLFMMQSRPYGILISLVIAQGLFFFLPEGWYQSMEKAAGYSASQIQEQRLQHRLKRMEHAMETIADAIMDKPVQARLSEKDMSLLCSDIAGRMCDKCEKHTICWGSEFHATYRVIGEVMQATQRFGRICRGDISGDFLERCPRSDEFVRLVNRYFEIYRLNLSWENRLEKNMRLSSLQLRSMAGQLRILAGTAGKTQDTEKKLFRKLSGHGFSVTGLWIVQEKEHDTNVRIRLNHPASQRTIRQVENLVSESVGHDMQAVSSRSCGYRVWEWEIRERLPYRVISGVVSSGQEEVNGDCYIRDRLYYNQYLLALSDGMGTGKKARQESELALSLLESLLSAGIPEEEAVSQLNLALLLHNREETYTTLDLGLIHLYTGEMTLVKAGGALSLIKTKDHIRLLRSKALPIGILDDIDPSIYHEQLSEGDLVLMMSDGIVDQVPDIQQAELLIKRILMQTEDTMSPQQVAETVYDAILTAYGSKIQDDVTILAARIVAEDLTLQGKSCTITGKAAGKA